MAAWQGNLQIDYGMEQAKTIVRSCYNKAPLRVQRPFYPEGDRVCHSVIVHTAGGIVGGDRLSIDLNLAPRSHGVVTTAAAAKIYGSDGLLATQQIQFALGKDAVLEWLPQETIVYEGAEFQQDISVTLDAGATWVGMDLVRFGRTARGESFRSGQWRSRTSVWQAGKPLWMDRSFLQGGNERMISPTALGGYSVIGTFVCLGFPLERETMVQLRQNCFPRELGDCQWGISRLLSGMICRYRGNSTEQARQYYLKIWESLRRNYTDRGICIPRVWQCLTV